MLAALAAAAAVLFAAEPATAASVSLQPKAAPGDSTCSPPLGSGPHRCYSQRWTSDGVMGVQSISGSGMVAPTPYAVDASATAANTAAHPLTTRPTKITYTWSFRVGCIGCSGGVRSWTQVKRGAVANYVALQLAATHSACTSCSASTRKVLIGSQTPTTTSGYKELPLSSSITIAVTVTNRNGGPIPTGQVTLKADLQGRSAWSLDPTLHLFEGYAEAYGALTTRSVTASY